MIIRQLKPLLVLGGVLLLFLLGQNATGGQPVAAKFSTTAALITAARVSPARVTGDYGESKPGGNSSRLGYTLPVLVNEPVVMTGYVYLPAVNRSPEVDFAARVIEQTNAYRALYGCPPLNRSQQLATAALRHSTDMALHDFVSHTGSDGSSYVSRSQEAGYWNWSRIAENVGAGYNTPEEVVAAWMASGGGHRDNIINCEFKDVGVGYYYLENDRGSTNYHTYWTQLFGATW